MIQSCTHGGDDVFCFSRKRNIDLEGPSEFPILFASESKRIPSVLFAGLLFLLSAFTGTCSPLLFAEQNIYEVTTECDLYSIVYDQYYPTPQQLPLFSWIGSSLDGVVVGNKQQKHGVFSGPSSSVGFSWAAWYVYPEGTVIIPGSYSVKITKNGKRYIDREGEMPLDLVWFIPGTSPQLNEWNVNFSIPFGDNYPGDAQPPSLTPPHTPPPGCDCPNNDGLSGTKPRPRVPGLKANGHSSVNNQTLAFTHTAFDYHLTGNAGCATCGGSTAGATNASTLTLERLCPPRQNSPL